MRAQVRADCGVKQIGHDLRLRGAYEWGGLCVDLAYLLRYDTVYGRFGGEIRVEADALVIDGTRIKVLAEQEAQTPRYNGILDVSRDPLVSADIVGDPHAAMVDLSLTRVVAHTLVLGVPAAV